MIPLNYIVALYLVDAASMMYLGYYDMKYVEFPIYAIPLALIMPGILSYFLWSTPLYPILLAVIITIFLACIVIGSMGIMDIVLAPRVALLLPLIVLINNSIPLLLIGFTAGVLLGLYTHYRRVKDLLCPGAKFLSKKTLVTCDALVSKYVIPVDVPAEASEEEIERRKRELYEKCKDCVEAVIHRSTLHIYVRIRLRTSRSPSSSSTAFHVNRYILIKT